MARPQSHLGMTLLAFVATLALGAGAACDSSSGSDAETGGAGTGGASTGGAGTGGSAGAPTCGSCTCLDALTKKCTPSCAAVEDQVDAVKTCGAGVPDSPECAACAAEGNLAQCAACYESCADELDTCVLGLSTCTNKYPTCRAALESGVVVTSNELCGAQSLAFLALGQCACTSGCGDVCPRLCRGEKVEEDLSACSSCFSEAYLGICKDVYDACRLGTATGAGGGGP